MKNLTELIGLDIYLIDQIIKGAFNDGIKILDAGCGGGRNMKWFVEAGYSIVGCDIDEDRIQHAMIHTNLDENSFKKSTVEEMPYQDEMFDYVISCAVLHFSKTEKQFLDMIREMSRVLKIGGQVFIRTASVFGLPNNYGELEKGRFLLQDGTERFLLTDNLLDEIKKIGFQQTEPLKTTVVETLRSMSTLVLRKI